MPKINLIEKGAIAPKPNANNPFFVEKYPSEEPSLEGINNSFIREAHPRYNKATPEKVVEGTNNQFIILGRDRPGNLASGYGGEGNTHCGMIDIVAGMSGMFAREVDPETGEPVYTDKSFALDAARIYISQRTDVDKNFGLVDGSVGSPTLRSAIAMKADGIRIVARNGIKLVTGTDTHNSQGVQELISAGIDLIAGNDDRDLQPLVKGSNMIKCVVDLAEHTADLSSIVLKMVKHIFQLEAALAVHTHICTAPGSPSSPAPLLATNIATGYPGLIKLVGEMMQFTKDNVMIKLNNTQPFGENYINSQYNTTN